MYNSRDDHGLDSTLESDMTEYAVYIFQENHTGAMKTLGIVIEHRVPRRTGHYVHLAHQTNTRSCP
jgi:hypothetical protein